MSDGISAARGPARTWGSKVKESTQAVPLTTAPSQRDRGTRTNGVLDSAELTVFKSGSFGLKLKFVLEGQQRAAYENIVLRLMNKDGDLVNTEYGETNLKRRLQAFGFTAEQIIAFGLPKSMKDEKAKEILATLKGIPCVVYVATREYMGKPQLDVKSVWPVDKE